MLWSSFFNTYVCADNHPTVLQGMESDELSGENNKSKKAETVPKNSSTVGSSVKREHTGNLSATTRKTGYISFRMFILHSLQN